MAVRPSTFTQRVRRDSSLTLPIFLRRLGPLLQFAKLFWDLVADPIPTRAVIQSTICASPCLLLYYIPRHFFSSDQPMSYNLFCTQSTSTTSFLVTLSLGLDPVTLLLSSPHTRALLPISSNRTSWLAPEASYSRPSGRPLSSPPLLALQQKQGVPLRPLDAKITTFAHACTHGPSHLDFKDLLPPCLLLFFSPFSQPDTLRANKRGHGGMFFSHVQFASPPVPAAAATCLLQLQPFCRRGANACPPSLAVPNRLMKARFFTVSENFTSHFFSSPSPSLPNCLVPVLKSTRNIQPSSPEHSFSSLHS